MSMIEIKSGNTDKETIKISAEEIVKVLDASFQHRSEAVTIKALDVLETTMDCSVSGLSISDCNFTTNAEEDFNKYTPEDCEED